MPMHTKLQSESLEGRNHFGGLVIDEAIILKWIFQKQSFRVSIRLNWLRIVSYGGIL
jgi:hypothetical protein